MRYKDYRGWLYEVRQGLHIAGWTIHCFNPKKNKWWPWPCASWYEKQGQAERVLKKTAADRGWEKVEQKEG
ncbi:MAG: hypothetical protein IJV46_06890 [Acidaminococcaceae bacterium]|nr:hypothetical protein [Acidaminococcaceae bacterium]